MVGEEKEKAMKRIEDEKAKAQAKMDEVENAQDDPEAMAKVGGCTYAILTLPTTAHHHPPPTHHALRTTHPLTYASRHHTPSLAHFPQLAEDNPEAAAMAEDIAKDPDKREKALKQIQEIKDAKAKIMGGGEELRTCYTRHIR